MSSSVRPASSTAARQASIGERQRVAHQPPAHRRAADAREHRLVLEPVGRQRHVRRRQRGLADQVAVVELAGRGEQREPDVLVLLEADRHLLADAHRLGVAVDDVGGEAHRRVLGQRHVGDHVGRVEAREPLVVVDREPDDGRLARHRDGRVGPTPAPGTDRGRRVDQLAAVVAALDPQRPVLAGRPEPLVPRGQLGQQSHRQLLGTAAAVRSSGGGSCRGFYRAACRTSASPCRRRADRVTGPCGRRRGRDRRRPAPSRRR